MPTNFTSVGIKNTLVVGGVATFASVVATLVTITTLNAVTANITTANITTLEAATASMATLRVLGTASGDSLTIQKTVSGSGSLEMNGTISGALVPVFSEAGDRKNKAVCYGTGGRLGQCMTAVTAAGVCSCLIP